MQHGLLHTAQKAEAGRCNLSSNNKGTKQLIQKPTSSAIFHLKESFVMITYIIDDVEHVAV